MNQLQGCGTCPNGDKAGNLQSIYSNACAWVCAFEIAENVDKLLVHNAQNESEELHGPKCNNDFTKSDRVVSECDRL